MRGSENDFEAPLGRLDAWKSVLACGKCPERTGSSVFRGPFGGRIARCPRPSPWHTIDRYALV